MKKIISIALSDGKAYVVRLDMERGGLVCRSAEKIPIASAASIAETETKGVPLIMTFPEEQCYMHVVRLDNQTDQANIAEKVTDEIAHVMPIARNEAEIRWEYNKTKKRVVAAAAKKKDITSLRVLCDRFQPERVLLYPEPLAIWTSLRNQAVGGAIIIDCGEYRTNAIFLDEEGFLGSYVLKRRNENIHTLIARQFRVSVSQAQVMRKSIGMDATQERGKLCEFLQKEFSETQREYIHLLEGARERYQKPFVTFLFIGEIVDTPHLIERFHGQISGTVALADPWHNIPLQSVPQRLRRDTGFAAAIGGAMRSKDFSDTPPLNFNDSALFHELGSTSSHSRLPTRRALFVIAAAALAIAVMMLWKTLQSKLYPAILPGETELAIFVGEGVLNNTVRGQLWDTTVSIADTFPSTGFAETPLHASGTVRVITAEDIRNAIFHLQQRAAAQALKLFKGQATDESQTFLREPITTTIIEENVFAEPGDIGESFSLSLRTHITMVSFPQEDAWKHIAKTLQWDEEDFISQIDQEKEIQATFLTYSPETKVVHVKVLLSDNNTP